MYAPWQLGDTELRWREGRNAAMAREMELLRPNTVAHGELVPHNYPFYPWFASVLHRAGLGIELSLRLVSVLSVAALTALVWEAGRRASSVQAANVAAASAFSMLIVAEKAMDGYPHATGFFFVFSAWLAWFTYGVARGNWNKAWIFAFMLCGFAYYTLGWPSVLIFIVPLIFMRRPMTVWRRLKTRGFFIGLAILAFFIFIWWYPRWQALKEIPFSNFEFHAESLEKYLMHLLAFPFEVIIRFLPWSLLAWPSFCIAYHPLEKNPIFNRFLRIICFSIFFVFWLLPFSQSRDLLILAAPLSLLAGSNYWILVRRYGFLIQRNLRRLSFLAVILSSAAVLFYIIPVQCWSDWFTLERGTGFRTESMLPGLITGATALAVSLSCAYYFYRRGTVWMHVLLICVSVSLCYWAVINPYRASSRKQHELAYEIEKVVLEYGEDSLDADSVVFLAPEISGFYSTGAYLPGTVRKISSFSELPKTDECVYLISVRSVPPPSGRTWKNLSKNHVKPVRYEEYGLNIWQGRIIDNEESSSNASDSF